MSIGVVAIRVDIKGDDLKITTLGSSPRGTRFRLKSVDVTGVKGPKAALQSKVDAALNQLVAASPGLPE